MSLTLLDAILFVIVLISSILAMIRGFAREVLSIAAWVAAAAVAYFFYDDLLPIVADYVDNETIQYAIAIGSLFLVTLLLVSLVTMRLSDIILDSRMGPADRLLGLAFGAARGVLLVAVALVFVNWFTCQTVDDETICEDRPGFITDAVSFDFLNTIAEQLIKLLPEDEGTDDPDVEDVLQSGQSVDDVL